MNRREFLLTAPALAGLSGCLGLDPRLLISPPIDTAALSDANTAFAFELFDQVRRKPGNFVVSPFAVSTSLALASAGAAGETLAEFQTLLHRPDTAKIAAEGDAAMQRQLAAGLSQSGCQLRSAYALWAHRALPIRDEFRRLAQDRYAGALQFADFGQPEAAVRAVNNWAELQTAFKVKGLVAAGQLPDSTRLLLASATYFKSYWARAFPKAMSAYDSFHSAGGKSTAMFMRTAGSFFAVEDATVRAVEIPFAGGGLSIVVALPAQPADMDSLETEFGAGLLRRFDDEKKGRRMLVTLPRLHLDTDFRLDEPLRALGVVRAFQAGDADWSRLTGDGGVALNAVVHKSVLDFAEDGAHAELASANSAQPKPAKDSPDAELFAVNRPFLLAIREATSRNVLLFGRVEKL